MRILHNKGKISVETEYRASYPSKKNEEVYKHRNHERRRIKQTVNNL